MHELTKDQAAMLTHINMRINALLKDSEEKEHLDTEEALRLLKMTEDVTASILWGTK